MFIKRCPWCGEELGIISGVTTRWYPYHKCPNCNNKYSLERPRSIWIYIPIFIYLIMMFKGLYQNELRNTIAIVMACLSTIPLSLFVPLARWQPAELITMYSVNYEVKCSIKWNKPWHILRFFIYSGFITPVIFFKDNNVQISDAWCGVFRKIRHIGKKTRCEFEFVVDDAPKKLLEVGNQFKIYYKKKEIGVGSIYDVFL